MSYYCETQRYTYINMQFEVSKSVLYNNHCCIDVQCAYITTQLEACNDISHNSIFALAYNNDSNNNC